MAFGGFSSKEKDRARVAQAIVVLTASGYCCALTARELLKLQRQRPRKAIQRGLAAGRPIAEMPRELDSG